MAKIRNEELDQLAGEVLPERAVLGLLGGPTVTSACSNIASSGLTGLLGTINSVSCVPANSAG
jgi:hypothetical protein